MKRAVEAGEIVANWDPHTHPIVTEVEGKVVFENMVEGVTIRRLTDELTGLSSISVIDPKERPSAGKDVRPAVRLVDDEGEAICCWLELICRRTISLKQMPS